MLKCIGEYVTHPNDTSAEKQLKSLLGALFLGLFLVLACLLIVWHSFPYYELDYSKTAWRMWVPSTIFMCVGCVVILVGLKCIGLTPGFRLWTCTFVFICVTIACTTGNLHDPWQVLYILLLDCMLVLRTEGNAYIMDRLSFAIQVYVVLYVTVFVILMACTEGGKTDLGRIIFPIQERESFSFVARWICGVVPIILSFNLVKWYARTNWKQAREAEEAAELFSQISVSLADYDLEKAKELLSEAKESSKAKAGFQPKMLQALSSLLESLQNFRAHLPPSLFEKADVAAPPNDNIAELTQGKCMNRQRANCAVTRLRDPSYSLEEFREDVEAAFPELQLYTYTPLCTSGWSGIEEYQRTMGALYATYCLARLDIDGKEIFTFGIDSDGRPRRGPHGVAANKQQEFYDNMSWDNLLDLTRRAGLLCQDSKAELQVKPERMFAFLALTAVHDIMKNPALLPTVQRRHAPYDDYSEGCKIVDHDLALAYVIEYFPQLLPSFKEMSPGQRAPVLFTQSKMGFNNGWLVQGEAPPGALFSKFKRIVMSGGASEADISFYFVHWLTDLAGAEPYQARPWPGSEKFVSKFPMKVLMAFLESFTFVDQLATKSEVQVMEDYLQQRWQGLGPPASFVSDGCQVASMRVALMAQGFEADSVAALQKLPEAERKLLSAELARTGCQQQFREAPSDLRATVPQGPALLVYYAPALVQKAGPRQVQQALSILAEVLAAARKLFPLDDSSFERTACIRIDALKVLTPEEVEDARPWHLRRTSPSDAEAVRGPLTAETEEVALEALANLGVEKVMSMCSMAHPCIIETEMLEKPASADLCLWQGGCWDKPTG